MRFSELTQAVAHAVYHYLRRSLRLAPALVAYIVLPTAWASDPAIIPTPSAQIAAQASCPKSFSGLLPNSADATRAKLQTLLSLDVCGMRPDYHAYVGTLLLSLGQYANAAIYLEKSLMLNPDQPGAKLDYAHALARLGERSTAQDIVNQVATHPEIDPNLKQWLLGIGPSADELLSQWSWNQFLQFNVGYETNLNSASSAEFVTLFLPNGPIAAPLTDESKPQSGTAFKTQFAVKGQSSASFPNFEVMLVLQNRAGAQASEQNIVGLSAAHSRPAGVGWAQLRWDGYQYQKNKAYTQTNHSLSLKYQIFLPNAPCYMSPGVMRTKQSFNSSMQHLNGAKTHLNLDGACRHKNASVTQWGLGVAQDRAATAQRLGGDKKSLYWSMSHQKTLAKADAQIWIRHNQVNESEIFSPLLGDLINRSKRTDLGVGAWWPWVGHWKFGVEVELTSQKSSNPLLEFKNASIYSGLRWAKK